MAKKYAAQLWDKICKNLQEQDYEIPTNSVIISYKPHTVFKEMTIMCLLLPSDITVPNSTPNTWTNLELTQLGHHRRPLVFGLQSHLTRSVWMPDLLPICALSPANSTDNLQFGFNLPNWIPIQIINSCYCMYLCFLLFYVQQWVIQSD